MQKAAAGSRKHEQQMLIQFLAQDISFSLSTKSKTRKLILSIIRKEKRGAGRICFIFCSDKFLLSLNKTFLRHNALTDIITFAYSHKKQKLNGEIYISIPRVKENAKKYRVTFKDELLRVMIHGILHLCGYRDKKPKEKKEMRQKEDYYLSCAKIEQ